MNIKKVSKVLNCFGRRRLNLSNGKWSKVLNWEFETPNVAWFIGGKLNITENCLDRHLEKIPDKTAIIWETQ